MNPETLDPELLDRIASFRKRLAEFELKEQRMHRVIESLAEMFENLTCNLSSMSIGSSRPQPETASAFPVVADPGQPGAPVGGCDELAGGVSEAAGEILARNA
ncbi:MAG: hypothetical protein AB7T14_04010 [Candidatus Methylacidiphilaceae bacterium]